MFATSHGFKMTNGGEPMKIVFPTLHVRRSVQAISLAAGCLKAALPLSLRENTLLLDLFPEQSDQTILTTILETKPQVVAFPVYVWNRQRIITLANQLHRLQPDLYLIAGGPEATGNPTELQTAAPWAALIHGEGEESLARLLTALATGAAVQPLPGVTQFTADGPVIGTPCLQHELNNLPSPWLSGTLVPKESSGVLWEVARGCAFSCDYCFDARGYPGVRTIDRERLSAELELFVQSGVSQVWVLDATFNYPPERGINLLELLLEKAPNIHYHLEAKADFLDRHTVSLLSQLSCSLQLGLQSIHEQVLKAIRRPLALDSFVEKIHLLETEGIIYGFDLIYGLPKDNYAGFRASVDAALSFSPNHLHIFPLAVLPGTRLAQQSARYGIKAQQEPPYEMLSSDNWTAEELEHCRKLAAAVDIFYNIGRAVAFFPAILQALNTQPSKLLEDFFVWAKQQPDIDDASLMLAGNWQADDAYRMLQGFLSERLKQAGQAHLISIFLDLLCYHFHYAETLLGDELPALELADPTQVDFWETPWRRPSKLRMVPFAYEILDLLEMEGMQLEEFAEMFRPVGSVALFMRRDDEVFCESLGEDMLRLLQQSNGSLSPKEIFAGSLSQATGKELVEFAVYEGLLQPFSATLAP